MAKCIRCGKSVSFFDAWCDDCKRAIQLSKEGVNNGGLTKIKHITGLEFSQGDEVIVSREGDSIKFSKGTKTKTLAISEMKRLELVDESGRSLGKVLGYGAVATFLTAGILTIPALALGAKKKWRTFIVIQVEPKDKPAYQIILGGEKQEEVRGQYQKLLSMIQ